MCGLSQFHDIVQRGCCQVGEPHPHQSGLHGVPRQRNGVQVRDDEPRRNYIRLCDVSRERSNGNCIRGGDAEAAGGRAPGDHGRLCDLPHLDGVLCDRGDGGQAGKPHPHQWGVHAVPHQSEQSGAGGDESRRDHDWLHHLPRGECDGHCVHRGDAEAAGDGSHPDHGGLRELSQEHHHIRSGHSDEPRRDQQRLRDLSRHRQELYRRDGQDQADEPPADHGDLRELSHGEQLHQFRRHGDEPQWDHQWLHDVPRGGRCGQGVCGRDAEAAGGRATWRPRPIARPATPRRCPLRSG